MKVLQPVPVRVLASRIIPSVDPGLVAAFKLEPRHRALALFTSDSDDVSYIAIDEATKKAAVDVVYASSFYGGAAHASGPYSGEFIGILAAETPGDVEEGLRIAVDYAQNRVSFLTADPEGKLIFLSHLVSSCGRHGVGMAHCAAAGGYVRSGCGAEGCGRSVGEAFPPAVRDQLFRRLACRGSGGVPGGVSGVHRSRARRCRRSIGKNLIF